MRSIPRSLVVLLCALALVLVGYFALDRWQRHTIFSVELGESRWRRDPLPDTEIFDIAVSGGEKVRAWYVPASDPDAPAILYLHGSRWNLNDSVFRIERWASMGYSILAIDYRGFGASSPRLPSQTSTVEDAIAGLKELARRHPSSTSRFVYGHSMGGAVAAALAAQPHRPEFAGLILESTFTSIRDMIAVTAWAKVPGLPLLVTQPFDSATALRSSREPVLLLHGTADRVVPHTMSDALYAAAQTAPFRKLVKIEGASHSGASSSRDYREAVQQFVNEAASRQQADEKRTVRPDQIKGKPL